MQPISCREILEATGGSLISGKLDTLFANITTDSRRAGKGDLFIPIIGQRFDGHEFIGNALESGAEGVLTTKEIQAIEEKAVIKVDDTLRALQDIASWYRSKFDIPFVAVTGSVGKTSTKDMIAHVMSQKFNTLKTAGNFNNEIGLPLTILNLNESHQAAVLEMGMSGFNEISRLSAVTKPDVAVITNIGMAHIEKLGSRQNILKAKMEIFEGLNKNGLVVLNGDDNLLNGLKGLLEFKTLFYGMGEGLDYQAYNIQTSGENGSCFNIIVGDKEYKVDVPVPGIHNVYNVLAAIAVGSYFGIPMEKIVDAVREFQPSGMRLDILTYNGIKIINDTYNASPQSMEAAILVLKDMKASRRIAVLGDMLEMGEWAHDAHLDVGKFAAENETDYLFTVGENGRYIAEGAIQSGMPREKVFSYEDTGLAVVFLKELLKSGDAVLVKGSRGMKMESIVQALTDGKPSVDIGH